jgi:DHA1 family tetracycline resistance protein-like MFS transporter
MTTDARADRPAAMRFIMLVVLIDMLSIGIIVPVLPSLVGHLADTPAQQAYWYGVIAFAFAIASFFGSPILGALSDAYGRRPILLIGFCGLAINFFATGLATALWMLVVSRIVGGAMQANAAVANAYVADITAPEDRTKRFGMLGAMFGIGFIAGPVIGGLLGGRDVHLPFFAAGVLSLINLAYGMFVLPESLPVEKRRRFDFARINPLSSLKTLAELQGSGRLIGIIACTSLAQFTLYTSWVLYTSYRFGWGPTENGWSLFTVGVVAALVQGVLLGRLVKRFSTRSLLVAGLVSSVLSYTAYGLVTQGWMLYVAIVAGFLGGIVQAVVQSSVSGATDASSQGRTLGAVTALSSLAAVVSPLIAAPILAHVSHLARDDWRLGAPMFFCALLQALALLFAVSHFRQVSRSQPASITAPST